MALLPAAGYRRMPWKNGGGETFEIAVSPPDASLEDMDWRISMAIVASDGPFSSFPGVDRTLTILDGEGMQLELGAERTPFRLSPQSAPFHFPADVPTAAQLLGGTVTDLNVMTRRGRYRHMVRRIALDEPRQFETAASEAAVFCIQGSAVCSAGDASAAAALQARDCALFTLPAGVQLELAPQPVAVVLLAEFFRD